MHYCHYVPILQTIKVLIDNDLIPIKSDRRANNMQLPVFTDITDGKIFKENTLFGSEENALSVILFQDAFEVVNPLGSAKKKHKILAVYFTLGNIPPQYRSQVESLQLALLCREVDFKKYGQEKLNFQSGEPYALGKCRSPTEYDRCVEHLQQSGEDSFEGIKFNSLFNNLNYFHVCNPGLPPCLGHDLFEGVVDYDLKLYIDYWVNQRHWFTYQDLNRKLELFKFTGSDINNKPAQINSNKSRLGGNAVENWCLLKLLPILVGQQILDKSDNVWKQFLRLREIVQLVCAPQISWDEIVYLKVLIEEYHEERKQIFPDVKLRPKHHFLCHYPELTVKFGPLIRVWTLRFESKHSYFKRCARNCHNFVNVTHTLSERHQQLQAYNSAGSMFPEKNFIEKGEQLNPEIFSPEIRASLQSKELQVDSATVSNKLKVYGTQYSAGLFVACKCTDSVLQFGCILLTLLCNNDAFLVVKLHNATLLEELGVYLLQPSNDIDCLKVSELCDYYPLSAYPVQGRLLLPLKHNCFHS
ncbi:Interferon-induced protein 44 [Apostichopus japonicus]|uniref:Interferon-induced protein 44 n=1 Tax=Stichopus japonicus TaxID=307972 RepID=A0A2G8LHB5_STIJA|nr:Interferon-induced protein 44 [Apostichopus japonicus]